MRQSVGWLRGLGHIVLAQAIGEQLRAERLSHFERLLDPEDVATVSALQDKFGLRAGSSQPFVPTNYDTATLDATRDALVALARGLYRFDRGFGAKEEVNPVRHLLGTAYGWGGLPDHEASYLAVEPELPVGEYTLTVRDA